MPPLSSTAYPLHRQVIPRHLTSVLELKGQWSNPSDILSLLLLLGPDVIQRALAQLVGRRVTTVAFSFGWVAYSIGALISAVGDQRLMPPADFRAIVVGANSGHVRHNKSWIIGRLLRDYEQKAKPLSTDKTSANWESLRVSVFKTVSGSVAGRPIHDWVWYSGFGVFLIQLAIATAPLFLYADWVVLLITVWGTILALSHGVLTQWQKEKWECPKSGGGTVTITQGNGSRHAMVILGGRDAPDLEILAYCDGKIVSSLSTRIASAIQTVLWLALVITVAGLKQGAWYLLAIGTVGMLQNIFVAGCVRQPEASGIHTELVNTISDNKVAKVLAKVEELYPLVGSSLLPVFYPAGFRAPADQKRFWKQASWRRNTFISGINADSVDEAEILSETHEQVREPVDFRISEATTENQGQKTTEQR